MNDQSPAAFAGWEHIVSQFPIQHLWNESGQRDHSRIRNLEVSDLNTLISENQNIRFVVAEIGKTLRWYSRGDFGIWSHYALEHPDAFILSEWISDSEGTVILLEKHPERAEQGAAANP